MKWIFVAVWLLFSACSHTMLTSDQEGLRIISFSEGKSFKFKNIRTLEAKYSLELSPTASLMAFVEEAKNAQIQLMSHIVVTVVNNEQSCIIYIGTKEDLESIVPNQSPEKSPPRFDLRTLSEAHSKELLYESKPFCRVIDKKKSVLISGYFITSRTYTSN